MPTTTTTTPSTERAERLRDTPERSGRTIPRDAAFDSSLALFEDGYRYIGKRCAQLRSDVVETRLLLQRTILMRGRDAAELLYDPSRFVREGAAPRRLKKTLIGEGGVQGLDGAAHRQRKAMFMSLMTPEAIARLAALTRAEWRAAARRWAQADEVVLLDASMEVLMRAVCAWAGVPLAEDEVARRTREMAAMIDAAGSVGLRYARGRLGRLIAERWASDLVEQVRSGELEPPEDSALSVIAWYRDADHQPLDSHTAAVELLNVLRPTVAIGRFIAFSALALHEHPELRADLVDDDAARERFVQEVRRYYPFFPFVAARVRETFTWRGYRFEQGTRVLLDLYGTDRDPRVWDEADTFRPERFLRREPGPFELVPQGGGEHHVHHRCAGEWITIALMKVALELLTGEMTYEVPEQDLTVDLSRMPAKPASGFVMREVRPR